jgi:hypothetical protein
MEGFVGRRAPDQKRGNSRIIILFLVFAALIGYVHFRYKNNSAQKEESSKALTEIQKQFTRFFKSSTDSKGLPKPIEERFDTAPKAQGDYGEMEKFTKELLNGMAEQRNGYLAELKAIGWEGILDAKRIKSDVGFVESREIIQKAKDTVATYQIKTDIFLKLSKRNIESLDVDESVKKEFAIGFENGLKESRKKVDTMWELERQIVGEFESIINLLASTTSSWTIEGDKIMFYNNSDLDKYNSHIAAIQKLSDRQTKIQKQGVDSLNREFNRLKS